MRPMPHATRPCRSRPTPTTIRALSVSRHSASSAVRLFRVSVYLLPRRARGPVTPRGASDWLRFLMTPANLPSPREGNAYLKPCLNLAIPRLPTSARAATKLTSLGLRTIVIIQLVQLNSLLLYQERRFADGIES